GDARRRPRSARAVAAGVFFYVGRTVHPVYREQFRAPPSGYAYTPSHPDLLDPTVPKREVVMRARRLRRARSAAELAAVRGLALAGYVRRSRVRPLPGTRLVHSGQFLLRESRLPYVVDFEDVHA